MGSWALLAVALLALLLSAGWPVEAVTTEDDRLIGWKGETYQPGGTLNSGGIDVTPLVSANTTQRKAWIQAISWKPRAFVYHNFLSDEECRHIVMMAHKQMKRSTVVGSNNGGVVDNVRTSHGTFLRRNQDPVINAIEQRLAIWSHLPASHQEDMQVLRYGPTNKYGPHIDGLERVLSVLMYIVEPKFGGETAFTQSEWSHPDLAKNVGNVSECAKGHVAYRPRKGDALLFYDMHPDYTQQDSHSMHTGCPVVEGVKWNAVKWIHGKPFRGDEYAKALTEPFTPLPDPGKCVDIDERCRGWAEGGECSKNPGYMIGSGNGFGSCRRACNDCDECADGDDACYKKNREKGGFLIFDEHELDTLRTQNLVD